MRTYTTGCCLLFVTIVNLQLVSSDKEAGDSSCVQYSLQSLWSSSLRDAPILSSPLLLDIDGDGYRDIVVTSSSGEVWALHGENGHVVDNWPFYLEDRAFFASPLPYDLNRDGEVDLVLATTTAEVLFLQTDNTLLRGETIKLPPLRVRRDWFQLDSSYVAALAAELKQQVGEDRIISTKVDDRKVIRPAGANSSSKKHFEAQYTQEDDPLISRHQRGPRLSGIDPTDSNYIFVDPHILSTPVLADMDEDGLEDELVVAVSYFFDSNYYGAHPDQLSKLGMEHDELVNYAAGAVVIVDLRSGQVVRQKLLGLTKVSADQPGYLLASPTVARLAFNEPMAVVIGSASGELHLLFGPALDSAGGYPLTMDSITAQAAVEDVTGDEVMEIVVADRSGNVFCLNRHGQRLWEQETSQAIETSVRFAKLGGNFSMEVILATNRGTIWVLNGITGHALRNSPISLNTHLFSSPLLIHLPSPNMDKGTKKRSLHLNAVVPSQDGLYVVDLETGCVDRFASDHLLYTVQADHIDPFNTGLEILATSLSGHLVCFSTGALHPPSDYELSMETWPSDTLSQNGFTHKSSSFFLISDHEPAIRDETGSNFILQFDIQDDRASDSKPHRYTIQVMVGRRYTLLNESIVVMKSTTSWRYTVPTPPSPMLTTVVLKVCSEHAQCDSATFRVRFNMTFHDVLKWCVSLPFIGLVAGYLWLLRNESTTSLPTAFRSPRKLL